MCLKYDLTECDTGVRPYAKAAGSVDHTTIQGQNGSWFFVLCVLCCYMKLLLFRPPTIVGGVMFYRCHFKTIRPTTGGSRTCKTGWGARSSAAQKFFWRGAIPSPENVLIWNLKLSNSSHLSAIFAV